MALSATTIFPVFFTTFKEKGKKRKSDNVLIWIILPTKLSPWVAVEFVSHPSFQNCGWQLSSISSRCQVTRIIPWGVSLHPLELLSFWCPHPSKAEGICFPSTLQLQSFAVFLQILLTGACYFHCLLQPLSSKSKLVTSSVAFFFKDEGKTLILNGNWAAQPYTHKQKSNNRKLRWQTRFTFIILVHESGYFDFSLSNLSSTASSASFSLQSTRWEPESQVGAVWI